ncbi:MAG: heme exporter protein CcmD [Candidatus Rokuibacteriota bacterium]
MKHWPFILAAYGLAAAVLLGYWGRVERRIRALEAELGEQKRP